MTVSSFLDRSIVLGFYVIQLPPNIRLDINYYYLVYKKPERTISPA